MTGNGRSCEPSLQLDLGNAMKTKHHLFNHTRLRSIPGSALAAITWIAFFPCQSSHGNEFISGDTVINGRLAIGEEATRFHFGTESLWVKAEKIRLRFDDVPLPGGEEQADWQFIFNDTGRITGGDFFAIESSVAQNRMFRIDGAAPENALRINDDGDVGLGVESPVQAIHIRRGNNPAIRLQQDNSSGFTPQAWDMAGNEANFFVRDVTHGHQVPFRIQAGAPTDSVNVRSNGKVGLAGATNPRANVHVHVDPDAGEGVIIGPGIGNDMVPANAATLHVEGTAFIAETLEIGSSRERKEHIGAFTLEEALTTLQDLQPRRFHYRGDPEAQLGFIAEDVPEMVATAERKSLRPMDFVALLTRIVQEHESTRQTLMQTVAQQEAAIASLTAQLQVIKGPASR